MTTVSDNFDRADGSLGSSWNVDAGSWAIASNAAKTTGSFTNRARYLTALTGSDQYAQITLSTLGSSTGVTVRAATTISWDDGYTAAVDASGVVTLRAQYQNGTASTIATSAAGTAASGDTLRVEALNTTIRALVNGTEVLSVTDSTITDSTNLSVRMRVHDTAISVDSFEAGDLTAAAAPTVSAGTDQTTTARGDATLTGSVTWASSHSGTLAWTAVTTGAPDITSGAATDTATISDAGTPSITSGTALADATYTYRLTATQDDSQVATDDVVLTVSFGTRYKASSDAFVALKPLQHAVDGVLV